MILCNKNIIDTEDLSISFPQGVPKLQHVSENRPDMTLEEMEKWLILNTLEKNDNNQKVTAQKLGISTTTLWRKLKQYGILTSESEAEKEKAN